MSLTSAAPDAAKQLLSGLGLAARARRLRIGVDAVSASVRRGEATAVVIAGDASQHTRRKLESLLEGEGPVRSVTVAPNGDRLGEAIGRERVVVVSITDRSLGRRVLELAEAVEG